jgi:hypothetical protein
VSAAPPWRWRITGSGTEAPDQLLANPFDWRVHPKAQQEALAGVLDEVGWVQNVLVNQRTGHVVDGHLRVALAISRGEPSIPVLYVDLSVEEERLVLARLDPLAAMATTDEEKLRELLAEISVDSEALAAMLTALAPAEPKDGLTDPDDVPEPPDQPVAKPGDLWLLGDHRLRCGDAGSESDLDWLLAGVTVDLLLTDPPYNVKVEPRSNNAIAAGMAVSYDASYQEALATSASRKRGTKALDAQVLHHSGSTWPGARAESPTTRSSMSSVIRRRPRPRTGSSAPRTARSSTTSSATRRSRRCSSPGSRTPHGSSARVARSTSGAATPTSATTPSPSRPPGPTSARRSSGTRSIPSSRARTSWVPTSGACTAGREGAAHRFFGPPNATDLWHVKKVTPQAMVHLTEKPVELARRAIEYSSLLREAVLDPFADSGSTLIACAQTGRQAYLMEVDPLYCDVVVQRRSAFSGREPTRG